MWRESFWRTRGCSYIDGLIGTVRRRKRRFVGWGGRNAEAYSALYFTADMGVSTYDAVSLILSEKKRWKFQFCRISSDLFCTIVGFLFGATVGIGTVVTAFFMGPLIAFFNRTVAEPMRYGKKTGK